ncbi:AzlD family protein [Halobacterium yunchengense]|uniref:AzlD family protein n=1 Tax=Halobacterium yunchengense TaxID=3108497 RepID=UPI00300A7241
MTDAVAPGALPADALALDPVVVGVVLAMAAVTYATKASGLWFLGRVDLSERTEAGLDVLPGAVVVAFVAPALANGGVPEWTAAAATVVVARKTGNLLASLAVGVAVVLAVRSVV